MARYKRVLCLGGGGARSLAELGFLAIMESEGILPDLIVGTSAGAIVGALFSLYASTHEAFEKIATLVNSETYRSLQLNPMKHEGIETGLFDRILKTMRERLLLAKILTKVSLVSENIVDTVFNELIGNHTFDDLKIPLAVVTLDIMTGETVVYTEGNLIPPLKASSAIPGVFPPVKYDNRLLVDAGPTDVVPVWVARILGGLSVIAIDVASEPLPDVHPERAYEIMFRAEQWASNRMRLIQFHDADLRVRIPLKDVTWDEFGKLNQIYEVGKSVAKDYLPEVKKVWSRFSILKKTLFPQRKNKYPIPITVIGSSERG